MSFSYGVSDMILLRFKPQSIMLTFLSILLLSSAQKSCLLCSLLCP